MTGWRERAEAASRALVDTYWDERRGLFRIVSGRRWPGTPGTWHYWWQAHALDTLVLSGDGARADRLVQGVLRRNGGGITNAYFDDMAWMGLALQNATAAGMLDGTALVEELMAALHTGFDPEHGAVRWRRGDTYLNVAANAPTAVLATRVGERAFAERLTAWLHATLVTPTGDVWDGVRPGQPVEKATWTYNYGTGVGASVATGDLAGARLAADAAARVLPGPDGVLPDEGAGDGSLFKGVFARHYASLVHAGGDAGPAELLTRNAEAAWAARSPDGLVGPSWTRPPTGPVELAAHLSGVLLFWTVANL